jgi:hypothetical protein
LSSSSSSSDEKGGSCYRDKMLAAAAAALAAAAAAAAQQKRKRGRKWCHMSIALSALDFAAQVVGSKISSNTKPLFQVVVGNLNTFWHS